MNDIFNTDIYNLAGLINDVEKQYTNETEDTLSIGIYGYFNAIFRRMMYNQIKMSSELFNEIFPTRARFTRNILTHAVFNNVTDINAVPAYMNILLCVPEEDYDKFIINNGTEYLIISKDCKFEVDDIEFHLDYDIKLYKRKILNNQTVYTAMYDIDNSNQLSDESNPYLPSPFIMNYNNSKYIYISCKIRQVEKETIVRKTLTDNPIMNKTLEIDFDNQLACFDIYANDDGTITHIIPIMEGAMISDLDPKIKYCFYNFLDDNKIRIKFEPAQYIPTLNTELQIVVQNTIGSSGEFTYSKNLFITLEDEKYQYDGMQVMIIPKDGSSKNGSDKKTISEIRKSIQKESLSRGVISISKDLDNHFNSLNTEDMRIQIQDKIHNQFSRQFYAYMVVKNNLGNIIPTNTINTIIDETKFEKFINKDSELKKVNLVIKQGSIVVMKQTEDLNWTSEILPKPELNLLSLEDYDFVYSVPFMSVITYNGPFCSFFANVANTIGDLSFTYINETPPIQFIAVNYLFERSYNSDSDIGNYRMTLQLTQNIDSDMGVIEFEDPIEGEEPTIKENNLKVIIVLYNKQNTPYRYMVSDFLSYDFDSTYKYNFKVDFNTNDILDENNYIRIENTMQPETENKVYGYLKPTVDMDIYVLNKFKNEEGVPIEYGREQLDEIVPNLAGYTVTNKYTAVNGLSFFTNYSDIMSVIVDPLSKTNGDSVDGFKLSGLPVVQYEYSQDESRMQTFMSTLNKNKEFVDESLLLLKNQFGIDLKFFNTYGPSNIYYLDSGFTERIKKVNIAVTFEVKLKKISDGTTKDNIAKDIKKLIEDIDDINSIHMPNIITAITNSYSSLIEYIEFKSIDNYGPSYQHIYRKDPDETYIVPEMLNINTKNGEPEIIIRVL